MLKEVHGLRHAFEHAEGLVPPDQCDIWAVLEVVVHLDVPRFVYQQVLEPDI